MEQITYNPTSALSILLAAVLINNDQSLDVIIIDSDSDEELLDALKEKGIKTNSFALDIISNEPDSIRATELAHGILSQLHDITDFATLMKLNAIFNGDKNVISDVSKIGKAINSFIESPYLKSMLKKVEAEYINSVIEPEDIDPNGFTSELDPPAIQLPAASIPEPEKKEDKKIRKGLDVDVKK